MKTLLSIIGIVILAIIGYLFYNGYRITKNDNTYIIGKDEEPKNKNVIHKLKSSDFEIYEFEGHYYLKYGAHCILHDPKCHCQKDSIK